MQYFRPMMWVILLLLGVWCFRQAYRYCENGLDDDGLVKVDIRTQMRTALVVLWVAGGFFSIAYAVLDMFGLFDMFRLLDPPPPSVQ